MAEYKALKKRFATPRRTRLVEGGDELVAQRTAAQRPNTELLRQRSFEGLSSDGRLVIQADGQVKVVGPQLLGRHRLEEPVQLEENPSPVRVLLPVSEKPTLLAFTESGRVTVIRWELARANPGYLDNFLPKSMCGERVVEILLLPRYIGDKAIALPSSDGRLKRMPLSDMQELSGRATSVLKLREGHQLVSAVLCKSKENVVVASSAGHVLNQELNEEDFPLMGRNAQGPMALRLLPEEHVAGACATNDGGDNVLLITRQDLTLRTSARVLGKMKRGMAGKKSIGIRGEDRVIELHIDEGLMISAVLEDWKSARREIEGSAKEYGTEIDVVRNYGIGGTRWKHKRKHQNASED